MKEIEFDTKVAKKDLYHFLMRHFYTSFSGIFGVILSLAALVGFILNIGKREPFQLLVLLVMASLFTVIQPIQMMQKAKNQIKRNPVFSKPLHYLVNDKGISVSQNGESSTIEWTEIRKILETKESFLIYMTTLNANVIPKEQIGEQKDLFRGLVKENMEKGTYKLS
ncbi:MAG: YcxB family protein [Velocimicrobium sp.]